MIHSIISDYDPAGLLSADRLIEQVAHGVDFRIVNFEKVRQNYRDLKRAFDYAAIHAAVKALTDIGVMELLKEEGSSFEISGEGELGICQRENINPANMLFTHPAKTGRSIQSAVMAGITRFVTDSKADIEKISAYGAKITDDSVQVLVRIATRTPEEGFKEARTFDERFGADEEMAKELIRMVKSRGMVPAGLAFHVGTQETDPAAWDAPIKIAGRIFRDMAREGIYLTTLDIGGGFPARNTPDILPPEVYAGRIKEKIGQHFGGGFLREGTIIIEPGRSIGGTAGVTLGSVVNVKRDPARRNQIVTLTCGEYSAGLIKGIGLSAEFFRFANDGTVEDLNNVPDAKRWPTDFYGMTCSSIDKPLKSGCAPELANHDIVCISGTGSYAGQVRTKWCSVPPPIDIFIGRNGILNSIDVPDGVKRTPQETQKLLSRRSVPVVPGPDC